MPKASDKLAQWLKQPTTTAGRMAKFTVRVVLHFYRNNGLLLASAMAYNTMLSIIPLSLVIVMAFAEIFSDELLYEVIFPELAIIVPGLDVVLGEVLRAFPENRELVGGIGLVVMLFFSSIAFRFLETAIGVIFHRPQLKGHRKFWVSFAIPYLFIVVIGLAVLVITALSAAVNALPYETFRLLDIRVRLREVTAFVIHVSALVGLVLLFTSLYVVMPTSQIKFKRALIGGLTAMALWEATRVMLVWFFGNISLVSVVYGSLATMVVLLVSMEIAAIIILFGAQVIAELEHSAQQGLPWHEE